MLTRRSMAFMLLGASAALGGCATDRPSSEVATEMLFISPMGEPFRARTPAPYPVAAWFTGADANGDGKLDLAEFLADSERFFHALDLTKDGVIDHREIFYYEHELVPEVLGQAEGRLRRPSSGGRLWLASDMQLAQMMPGGGGPGSGAVMGDGAPPANADGSAPRTTNNQPLVGAAPYNLLADPEPVEGADLRLTGSISLGDWQTRAQQRFKILDDDNRGYLTLATLPETQAQKLMPHPRRRRGPAGSA